MSSSTKNNCNNNNNNNNNNLKDIAAQFQTVIDNFRTNNGLLLESKQNPRPSNFSYEDVLRKVKYDIQNMEKEMKYIIALGKKNDNKQEDLAIAELSRQAKRSIEIDVQRIVSRWLREFIEQEKSNDVEDTFKAFLKVLESCSSTSGSNGNEKNNSVPPALQNQSGSDQPLQHQIITSSFSVIQIASSQLLDAALQWLLPRCLKRHDKAKQIILKLKNNQRKFLQMTKLILDEGAATKKLQDDQERLLAHCRVALTDFNSQVESIIASSTQGDADVSSNNNLNNLETASSSQKTDLQKISLLLQKFYSQMRQNLLLASTSLASSADSQQNQPQSANASFATTKSTRMTTGNISNNNNNTQHARKALLDLIRALEIESHESSSSINAHLSDHVSSNNTSSMNISTSSVGVVGLDEEKRDKMDLLSFLNELDDDVVVEIKASHVEKEKEIEERKYHLLNSKKANENNAKKTNRRKNNRKDDDDDDDDDAGKSQDQTVSSDTEEGETSYFDENDQFVLAGRSQRKKRSSSSSTSSSAAKKEHTKHQAAKKDQHRHAIASLRKELAKAQQSLETATQIGEEREAVIERMQQNLTRLTSLVEYFSSTSSTPAATPGDSLSTDKHLPQPEHSRDTNGSSAHSNELNMLRSQVAVQEERIHHLTSSLEERALRESALRREVEALLAGEGVLKGELSYQQTALRGCSDDLVLCQTSLFEVQEQLRRCDASRTQYVDAYNRLRQIAVADRRYTAQLHHQAKKMGQQLENSVLLEQVEEMLQLSGPSQYYYSPE